MSKRNTEILIEDILESIEKIERYTSNLRRGRDSNPRYPFGVYAISSRAPSANSDTPPNRP